MLVPERAGSLPIVRFLAFLERNPLILGRRIGSGAGLAAAAFYEFLCHYIGNPTTDDKLSFLWKKERNIDGDEAKRST
jgi:hypothetical protein